MSLEVQLRQRIAELEEENHYLRQLIIPVDALPTHWGLNRKQTVLVLTIAKAGGCVHRDRLRAALGNVKRDIGDRYLECYLHHVRRKLTPHGVEILTRRGVGIFMPPESRRAVLGALSAVAAGEVA